MKGGWRPNQWGQEWPYSHTCTLCWWLLWWPGDLVTRFWCAGGSEYLGEANTTRSGRPCQVWSATSPHVTKSPEVGDHNYCRNPARMPGGIFCYTTDPAQRGSTAVCPGSTAVPPSGSFTSPQTATTSATVPAIHPRLPGEGGPAPLLHHMLSPHGEDLAR